MVEDEEYDPMVDELEEGALMKWINDQLAGAEESRRVENLTEDLKDSVIYDILLGLINFEVCDPIDLNDDLMTRAGVICQNAADLGIFSAIEPEDIVSGNEMANRLFIRELIDYPLICWMNDQLEKAGSNRRIKNFGEDMSDSEVYNSVLQQVDPFDVVVPLPETDEDLYFKAGHIIENAQLLGLSERLDPADIVECNVEVNRNFVVEIILFARQYSDLNEQKDLGEDAVTAAAPTAVEVAAT